MNKIVKRLLFATIFGLSFLFTGCILDAPTITGIAMSSDAPTEILINEFNFEEYELTVSYSNGRTKNITLTEDMVDPLEYLNALKKEGDHEITVSYAGFECTYSFTVNKYEFDKSVKIKDETFEYDGQYHSLTVVGNYPENASIEFLDKNSYKNYIEGGYTVTARIACESYQTKFLTGTLTILKASYNTEQIHFDEVNYCEYDGQEKTIEVVGVDNGVDITYTYKNEKNETVTKMVDAGVYTVTASFKPSANYNEIPDLTTTFTINKKTYDMTPYTFVDKTVYYTGEKTDMHVSNNQSLPYGVTDSYIGLDNAINAGVYTIIARFTGDPNYNEIPDMEATLTIKPAVVGLTGIYLDSMSITYDGKEHGIEYSGNKPNSIVSKGYTIYNQNGDKIYDSSSTDKRYKHKPVDVGTYVVYAHFAYKDNKNYADIEPLSAILVINKADITDIVIENETKEYIPGMGQSLTVKTGMAGITATPSMANPVYPGDYLITYTFTLSDELAKNYNVPDPITKTLTITKRNIFASESSQKKFYATYDGELHTIDIELSVDESKWITPSLFYYNESQQEVPFTGISEPGTYLVFAKFVVDEDKAPENYKSYYNIPSRTSAYLIINKKQIEFDETWLANRMSTYDGATVSVTLNETEVIESTNKTGLQSFLEKNKGLESGDFTITYTNNHATDSGYYTGSLNVTINGTKTNYYDNLYNFEFHYAIKKNNKPEEIYPVVVQKTFDYDGKPHSIVLSNIPVGISLAYDGDVNELTLPGSSEVIIIFHCDNDVAKWYYSFPTIQTATLSGDPLMQVQLVVRRINYVPELEIPTYSYELGSESREIFVKKAVSGVDVEFVYDDEQRIDVGTYGVTVNVKITNTELLKIYNPTYSFRSEFTIIPTDYKFSFAGLNAIYDGNKHNVSVAGIDEEIKLGYISYSIEDQQGNPVDGYDQVGVYNIFIRFNNSSSNYNDVPNQSVQMVIETSKVKTQDLVDYVNDTTFARINQTDSVYSFLNSIIDTTPFNVTYKVDYWKTAEDIQYVDDPLFHGQGTDEDFEFSQFTTDTGYALLEFTLEFKTGYEAKDSGFTSTYHGYIKIKVLSINEYNISSSLSPLRNSLVIDQGSTLEETYLSGLANLDYSYTCQYVLDKDTDTEYDERYLYRAGTSEDETPFAFAYNTYGTRKVKVVLTIPAYEDYLFYDGIHSVSSVNETFYLDVNLVNTLDTYEVCDKLQSITNFDQFTKLDKKIESYYNSELYDLSYVIYDENDVQVSNSLNEGLVVVNGNYKVSYRIECKNDIILINNGENVYEFDQSITVNEVDNINLSSILESFNGLDDTLYQYDSLYREIVWTMAFPENLDYFNCSATARENAWSLAFPETLKVEFEVTTATNKVLTGNINDLKYGPAIQAKYIFSDFDNAIPDNNRVIVTFKFTPNEEGYVLYNKDNSEIYGNEYTITRTFNYNPRRLVEYYYIHSTLTGVNQNHNGIANQYTSLMDYYGYLYTNYKVYEDNELVDIVFEIYYEDKDGNKTLLSDDWDSLQTALVPGYDTWNENDKLTIKLELIATADDVVITTNPYISLNRYRNYWIVNYKIGKVNIDEGLTDKIEELTADDYEMEVLAYSDMTTYIEDNIMTYASSEGYKFDSYEITLVNTTTKKVDPNFIKVSRTKADDYYIYQIPANGKQYKLSVTFKKDSNTKYYLLSKDGKMSDTVVYDFYFTVLENENVINVSTLSSYSIPQYTQFNVVEDTIKKIAISDKLIIDQWSVVIPSKNGSEGYSYSGTLNSSTIISKDFSNDSNYGKTYFLYLTFKAKDNKTILVENNEVYDGEAYVQPYNFNIKFYVIPNLSALENFADSSKSSNMYFLRGYKPQDYVNYLLGKTANYSNMVSVEYVDIHYYTYNGIKQTLTCDTEIPTTAPFLNITIKLTCKSGYYFGVENGQPILEKTFTLSKQAKTAVKLDLTELVRYSNMVNMTVSSTYTFEYYAPSSYESSDFSFDSVTGTDIEYETVFYYNGIAYTNKYDKLNGLTVSKPGVNVVRVYLDWTFDFTDELQSYQAVEFVFDKCPIGYQTETNDYVTTSGRIEIIFAH